LARQDVLWVDLFSLLDEDSAVINELPGNTGVSVYLSAVHKLESLFTVEDALPKAVVHIKLPWHAFLGRLFLAGH